MGDNDPRKGLADVMEECLKFSEQFNLGARYILLVGSGKNMALPIDSVLNDGFLSNGVFYPFVAFSAIAEQDAVKLREKAESLHKGSN